MENQIGEPENRQYKKKSNNNHNKNLKKNDNVNKNCDLVILKMIMMKIVIIR